MPTPAGSPTLEVGARRGSGLIAGHHTAYGDLATVIAARYHRDELGLDDAVTLCAQVGYVMNLDVLTAAEIAVTLLVRPGENDAFRLEVAARIFTRSWPA